MKRFFITTLEAKFIKYLLSYTPIPLYPLIKHNQYMVKDGIYLYRNKLLKCTKSGIFNGLAQYEYIIDRLTASDELCVQDNTQVKDYLSIVNTNKDRSQSYVSSPLVVTNDLVLQTGFNFAEYTKINNYTFGEEDNNITQTFVSNSSYYDSQTHKFLGDYLRLLSNYYDINLMSLYNCYNCVTATNVSINNTSLTEEYVSDISDPNRKVLLIPIKFNNTYTIAMDCSQPILLKAVIYRGDTLVKTYIHDLSKKVIISNKLGDKPIKVNNCRFNKPFYFSISNKLDTTNKYLCDDEKLQNINKFANDLYLAIQVPKDYSSTVVVMEGTYSNEYSNVVSDFRITDTRDNQLMDQALPSIPSLLLNNDGEQHPFSDKLISYLLQNTIDTRDLISENVSWVQDLVHYSPEYKGIWDNKLRYILYHKYNNLKRKDINLNDILGYVDNDVEEALRKGYMS